MISREEYLALKREIKFWCRKNITKLCNEMELNDEERKFLMYFYDGKTRVQTCMELCVSATYYNNKMKIIFSKIKDYKNTFE